MQKSVFVFFAFLHLEYTNACSCLIRDKSNPRFLCDNKYVLRGEATNEAIIGYASMPNTGLYRVYSVKVQQVYRGSDIINTSISSVVNITTPEDSATCGVKIPLNKDLVLAGSSDRKKMTIYSCGGWIEEYKDISSDFREGLSDLSKICAGTSFIYDPNRIATVLSLQVLIYSVVSLVYV